MPRNTVCQLATIELRISDVVGCFFWARNSGVSSRERRITKMNGTIRQPMKKGMRQPQSAICIVLSDWLNAKPMIAAKKIATCWLADWNEV
jgi:hypothetical protein